MKVLLYTEGLKAIGKSGLGKAIEHQKRALDLVCVDYTLHNHDDYDDGEHCVQQLVRYVLLDDDGVLLAYNIQ